MELFYINLLRSYNNFQDPGRSNWIKNGIYIYVSKVIN